jgi:amidase
MAGPDPVEAAGWRLELKPPRWRAFKDLRVGVMLSDPVSEVDQAVQAKLQALADFLAQHGATVSDTARPALDTAAVQQLYVQMLRAATSGRQSDAVFAKNLQAARELKAGDESYFARMTRANVLPHREWLAGNEQRHRMRLVWAAFFEDWDLLLCPAAASVACPHDQVGERHERTITVNGKRVPTTDQLFWAGYSGLFYLPSTVAPIGLTAAGLPVGVQIIGPQYGDLACIALAQLLEKEYAGFVAPPGF